MQNILHKISSKLKIPLHYIGAFFGVLALTALFYGNTLGNGFIHDDHGQIEQNQYIQSWQYLPKVLSGCIWEAALGGCKERTSYYRPLQSLSYLITYTFSSGPSFFHFVNLIYLIIAGFLVYMLGYKLTQHALLSLSASTIFIIHPINTETVNWIATVPELLYVIFILLGMIFFIYYREISNKKYLIGSYISYFLGLLSKEPAFLLPILFFAFDWLYLKYSFKNFFRIKELKLYGIMGLIFAAYLALRISVLGSIGSGGFYTTNIQIRIISFFELAAQYLEKLIYPKPLLLFYYPFITSKSFFALKFIISFLIVASVIGLLVWLIKRNSRFLAFSMLWLLVFLIPGVVFINALGENVFSERYVFASSIGFSFLISYVFFWLAQKKFLFKVIIGIFAIILFSLSLKIVWARNYEWKSDDILYAITLQQNPEADLIRYNFAISKRDNGDEQFAKEQLEIIAQRGSWRDIYKAYNNLGTLARNQNDFTQAEYYFSKALASNANNERAYNNLGALNLEQGKPLNALIYFCKALRINPELKEANANFSRISGLLSNVNDIGYITLYQEIISGTPFAQSTTSSINFKTSFCSETDEVCHYIFSPKVGPQETLLPFLIMARTQNEELLKILGSSFNQKTEEIMITISKKFQDKPLEFIFPSCLGVYYKTIAN